MREFLDALNAHTIREEARLDRIFGELSAVREILSAQQGILDEHIKRSERLEGLLDTSREQVAVLKTEHAVAVKTVADSNDLVRSLNASLKPLLEQRSAWEAAGKALTVGAGLAGAVAGVLKFLGVW